MDRFWIEELRTKCNEISAADLNPEMVTKVIEAYDRILRCNDIARTEGLLALDKIRTELDMNDESEYLFNWMINLVTSGTDPDNIRTIGINRCIITNLPSYLGLINLMYIEGTRMIQDGGYNRWIISEIMKSMMPKAILDELIRKECETTIPIATEQAKQAEDVVKALCDDDKEIDEKDHSIINETAMTLIMLSDRTIRRLLREANSNHLVSVAMKGLPGKARARIFNNMSSLGILMTAGEMSYLEPFRMKDAEECCAKLMKILLKLDAQSEIYDHDYDFSVLKVVIDMFDSAEKENRELKEKYKKIKHIIDGIYNH